MLPIWLIAVTKYVVISVGHFLAASGDGAVEIVLLDPRMSSSPCGVLVFLPSGVYWKIGDTSFFEIISGCSFDLVAYVQSSKVDWN